MRARLGYHRPDGEDGFLRLLVGTRAFGVGDDTVCSLRMRFVDDFAVNAADIVTYAQY